MAKPSDHPGFKKLLAEWEKRLADSGFKDIEKTIKDGRILKIPGTRIRYEQMSQARRYAKYTYFMEIAQRIAETKFESEFEKEILILYAQGYSQAEIQRKLGVLGHRCKIYYPLYRWLTLWGLK